jgi:hypothetical protein
MARKNKTKKEVVSDIQLVQDSDRRRSLIKDILFPYLVEMNDTIGYTKVFIQAFSGLVTGAYDELAKKTTIGSMTPRLTEKLGEIFKVKEPEQKKEYDRYLKLVELLKDISVQDLAYATELPRYIDGFMLQGKNKESISKVDINAILGK